MSAETTRPSTGSNWSQPGSTNARAQTAADALKDQVGDALDRGKSNISDSAKAASDSLGDDLAKLREDMARMQQTLSKFASSAGGEAYRTAQTVGAAVASQVPFDDSEQQIAMWIDGFTTDPNDLTMVGSRAVTPGYMTALGIQLLRGRGCVLLARSAHEGERVDRRVTPDEVDTRQLEVALGSLRRAVAHLDDQLSGDVRRLERAFRRCGRRSRLHLCARRSDAGDRSCYKDYENP